jgi:hypothetical protein
MKTITLRFNQNSLRIGEFISRFEVEHLPSLLEFNGDMDVVMAAVEKEPLWRHRLTLPMGTLTRVFAEALGRIEAEGISMTVQEEGEVEGAEDLNN